MKRIKEGAIKVKKSKWGIVITVLLGLWLAAFAIAYLLSGKAAPVVGEGKIVFIPISGFISPDGSSNMPFGGETTSSAQIVDYLQQAKKDDNIKGVILEINSGGGTVIGSEEIANAVKEVKQKKPVVAWIREAGASGAYWIASASNKIVAYPMSITGSIGVTSSYLEFTGLMDEYGIGYEELTGGDYKDAGSPFRELKQEERKMLQDKIGMIHSYFIDAIAENRKMPKEEVEKISTGMFYLGKEFYDLGLVDYLGNKELAVNVTKELAGIKEASLVKYEKKKSILDVLSRLSSQAFYYIGRGIGAELQSQARASKTVEVLA